MKKRYRVKHEKRHMSLNIAGALQNTKKGKLTYIDDDDGQPLSDQRARFELNRMLVAGHRLMDCSGKCYRFDKNNGCPGHIISLMPNQEGMDKIELEWALFRQGKILAL